MKDLKDSKLILNESKINLVPYRTFREPLFPKPVTGQELFSAISYNKSALALMSLAFYQSISEYDEFLILSIIGKSPEVPFDGIVNFFSPLKSEKSNWSEKIV